LDFFKRTHALLNCSSLRRAARLSLVSDRFGELGAKQEDLRRAALQSMSTISAPAAP
jgi:hypothetical protein